jgi:hypothetical protein
VVEKRVGMSEPMDAEEALKRRRGPADSRESVTGSVYENALTSYTLPVTDSSYTSVVLTNCGSFPVMNATERRL